MIPLKKIPTGITGADEIYIRLMLDEHKPTCLVIDPISALMRVGSQFGEIICETLLDAPLQAVST